MAKFTSENLDMVKDLGIAKVLSVDDMTTEQRLNDTRITVTGSGLA